MTNNIINICILCIIIFFIVALYIHKHIYKKKYDFARIHNAIPALIFVPTSIEDLQNLVKKNYLSSNPLQISIAGAKYSHGGHTMASDAIYIDMSYIRDISLYSGKNMVSVGAGAKWKDLQAVLDVYNYSVAEMQSYRNFSVGGSISVNCHGRGLKYGTIADTIISLKLLTAQGDIINASRNENYELFKGVIGGYGAIAIILSADLVIDNNFPIERKVIITDRSNTKTIMDKIQNDNEVVFYNGNIYPKNNGKIVNILWYKSNKKLTDNARLQSYNSLHIKSKFGEQALRRTYTAKYLRSVFEPKILMKECVVWKNYEMSYDVDSINLYFHYPTTAILQEYFVPPKNMVQFINYLWNIVNDFNVNLINLSIRYVKKTDIPILNYASVDRIAIVLYLNIHNDTESIKYANIWTNLLVNKIISLSGSYYLPYLLFLSIRQFRILYPDYKKFVEIKQKYDNKNILTSHFIKKYIH